MGCCDSDTGCKSKRTRRRSIPWLGVIAVVLLVLVVLNWH